MRLRVPVDFRDAVESVATVDQWQNDDTSALVRRADGRDHAAVSRLGLGDVRPAQAPSLARSLVPQTGQDNVPLEMAAAQSAYASSPALRNAPKDMRTSLSSSSCGLFNGRA